MVVESLASEAVEKQGRKLCTQLIEAQFQIPIYNQRALKVIAQKKAIM